MLKVICTYYVSRNSGNIIHIPGIIISTLQIVFNIHFSAAFIIRVFFCSLLFDTIKKHSYHDFFYFLREIFVLGNPESIPFLPSMYNLKKTSKVMKS